MTTGRINQVTILNARVFRPGDTLNEQGRAVR